MKLLHEMLKADVAIAPVSLAPAAFGISGLVPMNLHRKAMAIVQFSSATLQGGDVLDIGIVDDTVVAPAASGALAVLEAAGSTIAFEHITASDHATSMSVETVASADGAITINGTVFAYVAVPVLATDWSSAAELAIAITAAGLGLTAVDVGTVVTINSTIPGQTVITLTETVTAIVAADILTLSGVAYMEVDSSELAAGSTGIRIVVDNPVANAGTIVASVALVRGEPRYAPVDQAVAAP